jgi:hypothetical protein
VAHQSPAGVMCPLLSRMVHQPSPPFSRRVEADRGLGRAPAVLGRRAGQNLEPVRGVLPPALEMLGVPVRLEIVQDVDHSLAVSKCASVCGSRLIRS